MTVLIIMPAGGQVCTARHYSLEDEIDVGVSDSKTGTVRTSKTLQSVPTVAQYDIPTDVRKPHVTSNLRCRSLINRQSSTLIRDCCR